MSEHPQAVDRDMIININNFRNSGKDMVLSGLPIKFSATPGEVKLTFPEAGEHTVEILSRAGYTAKEIELFKINEVV
jgi:crotonobetainyl-CoA:carnitine CoA-transferase CaiB-like acyl-CoA transferase